jgi:hypothetical protein
MGLQPSFTQERVMPSRIPSKHVAVLLLGVAAGGAAGGGFGGLFHVGTAGVLPGAFCGLAGGLAGGLTGWLVGGDKSFIVGAGILGALPGYMGHLVVALPTSLLGGAVYGVLGRAFGGRPDTGDPAKPTDQD